MCGIAGILLASCAADPRRLSAINAMNAALRHRGPDDGGTWIDADAGIALGHRRLAVVDLSEAGRQPMVSHDGGLILTYNGEVYNFIEIRKELEIIGHRFRGHSDTEVMLAAFESFGIDGALRRFAGMFALALWDRRSRTLHLIRDRFGKKPLYVACVDGALLFASELKALLSFPGFRPMIDRSALLTVLAQGWLPDRQCIWRGVFKILPGAMLSVRADDLCVAASTEQIHAQMQTWWSLAEVAEKGQRCLLRLPDCELEAELDRLLRLAVRERMVADVPLGAFLSGGIDSSAVVALMQAQSGRPIQTFTIGFREAEYNEADNASRVAQHLGTEHTELSMTATEACSVIPELPQIWDEPFAAESQIPTFLVSRLARQDVTVALSGDGGDESFAGYARHFAAARLAFILSLPAGPRRIAASALSLLSQDRLERCLRTLPLPAALSQAITGKKLLHVLDAADEQELYDRLTLIGSGHPSAAPISRSMGALPRLPDLATRFMYRDMAEYLPGNLLVKVDRASMAVSLEARCPFLDHRLIEFAWRLPTTTKVRNGRGKWLLRRVLRRYLPDVLFERPKHGFNVPIGAWLKGPLRSWAQDLLAEPQIVREGFVDPGQLNKCWLEHMMGRCDRGYELWAILMVEGWLIELRKSSGARATTSAMTAGQARDAANIAASLEG